MTKARLTQLLIGVIIAALVAMSIYTAWMIRQRHEMLSAVDRHDVTYAAYQTIVEYERFRTALMRFDRDPTSAALNQARVRFTMLSSRAGQLSKGKFLIFTTETSSYQRIVVDLQTAMGEFSPILASADINLDVSPLLANLQPLEHQIAVLAAVAAQHSTAQVRNDQNSLSQLYRQATALAAGLIVCGLGMATLLGWHNRLLASAHRRLSVTTRDLAKTADDLANANEIVAATNTELRCQNQRLQEKESALNARNVLFDAALNNMSQGLCMFDRQLQPLVCNRQFERLIRARLPEANDEGVGSDWLRDLVPELAAELEDNIRWDRAAEFETELYDGRLIAVTQRPMDGGGWVATFADVTEQRRAQARIVHMARHDGLTNLPNRYAFRERTQDALNACHDDNAMLAIMFMDLDNFKEVNDTLGHPMGDALLCAVAERLSGCVRDTDMVARFGGDEFAILQPRVESDDAAARLAARIVEEMRRPFLVDGELVYTTGSVGVAIAPKHGSDAVVLQKNADLALYAAKAEGRGTYRVFESQMDEQLASRHVLERDMREALAGEQFNLLYQPVVQLSTGQTEGFEALMRWTHPERGPVPPSTFIPIAEDAGLITEIGRWVLQQACAEAARWPADIKIAVNLSAAQFTRSDIVEDIRTALSRAGLRPERLVVEITESLLLTENITTINKLHRLKALGINIAMDDFGTGYSSLSYLRKYPFDCIKIDRCFVNAMSDGEQSVAIIKTIVQLADALGMTTVAEGVETQEELDALRAAGCPKGQGYLFAKPVPAGDVLTLIGRAEIAETADVTPSKVA